MRKAGAPKGNQNGRKGREWREALNKALKTFESKDLCVERGLALRKIAERVVEGALAGDKDCWQEIGNRLDGKAAQYVEVVGEIKHAHELSDDELADIATGHSEGAAGEAGSEGQSSQFH